MGVELSTNVILISYLVHTRLDMYIYGPFKNFKTKNFKTKDTLLDALFVRFQDLYMKVVI
jgi:hypothetical protein